MQIHELTRPRKVNEGLLGSLAAGIASQVGKQAMTKALGGTDVTAQPGPSLSREQGFKSMANSPAAAALATSMQKAWAQTVQNFLANSVDAQGNPATNLKSVTSPSVDSLQQELKALVNKMISGRTTGGDYTTLANNIQDPVAKAGIQEVIARINEYSEAIFKATVQGVDPKALVKDWTKLVGDGILPAQNAHAYDTKKAGSSSKIRAPWKDPSGRWIIDIGNGPEWLDRNKPEHKEALDKLYSGAA